MIYKKLVIGGVIWTLFYGGWVGIGSRAQEASDPETQMDLIPAGGGPRQDPPFQDELLLDEEKDPPTQVRILKDRLEENPQDPQNLRRLLTIAYLYDELLGQPEEAAEFYQKFAASMGGGAGGCTRTSSHPLAKYSLQARFRAAELLFQEGQKADSEQEKQHLWSRVAKLYGMINQATQPRYSLTGTPSPPPPPVWEKNAQGLWEEIPPEEVHQRALKRIDRISQNKWSYRMLDGLFRAMGGRPGISHFLALLVLAMVLKLILHPLNRKQYVSMAKMQEVQPQLKKVQEKFKDNPQKLQAEMMKLYREHGVNPLSGCFPMLIQLPVLFSVYGGIRAYTYQFSLAPPVLGIHLDQPNLFLLVVYGVSMFVQQKLMTMRNPQTASDPQQEQMQRMMMFMPLMFTVMMWMYGWPSAFYLYWLAFNVVSTAEQWFITSRLKPTPGSSSAPSSGSRAEGGAGNGPGEGEPGVAPGGKEGKDLRSRSRRRPLSVIPSSGSKDRRKRRVTRRR